MQNTVDRLLVFSGFVTSEMKLFNQSMLNAAGKVKTQAEYAGSMIDLGVQVQQAMPPPAPNPTVPLTNYHITDIHKNRSPKLSRRPRRPLRLFHNSSPSLTPPKHLHKYINFHTELIWLHPNAEPPLQHPYLHRRHLGRSARLLRRARTVTFLHRPSRGSSLQWASGPLPPLRHPRSQGWYSTPRRIAPLSCAQSRVALLGGAFARGGLRSSRRCVWYSPCGIL